MTRPSLSPLPPPPPPVGCNKLSPDEAPTRGGVVFNPTSRKKSCERVCTPPGRLPEEARESQIPEDPSPCHDIGINTSVWRVPFGKKSRNAFHAPTTAQ